MRSTSSGPHRSHSVREFPILGARQVGAADQMTSQSQHYYFGNASADQVRGSGWFIGQFVLPTLGLRHQTDVEIKWGLHLDGEKRMRPWANGNGITISILIRGTL